MKCMPFITLIQKHRGMERGGGGGATFNKICHVLERTCLLAVAEDGEGLAGEGLCNEIRDHTPIVQCHVGAVGVEYAYHTNLRFHHQCSSRTKLVYQRSLYNQDTL